MKYTGNIDPRDGALPGTEKLYEIWTQGKLKMSPLGVWANRPMRSSDPNAKPRLSVHATGRAFDAGFPAARKAWAETFFDWLVKHYEALGLEEIHNYSFGKWGRGFRCERKELGGKPGVKIWTETDNGGTPGGLWIHVELSPDMAQNPEKIAAAWKTVNANDPCPMF